MSKSAISSGLDPTASYIVTQADGSSESHVLTTDENLTITTVGGTTTISPTLGTESFTATASTIPNGYWTSGAYGNGIWVMISADSNNYITSTDGINWTARTFASGSVQRVIFAKTKFIVTKSGTGSGVFTSTTGTSWTFYSLPQDANWQALVYGNNGVTVAMIKTIYGDRYAYSANEGTTWKLGYFPTGVTFYVEDVAYGSDGKGGHAFVAITSNSDNLLGYSYDGVTWSVPAGVGNLFGLDMYRITYCTNALGGQFVIVCLNSTTIGFSSGPFAEWTMSNFGWGQATIPGSFTTAMNVKTVNNKVLIVGNSGTTNTTLYVYDPGVGTQTITIPADKWDGIATDGQKITIMSGANSNSLITSNAISTLGVILGNSDALGNLSTSAINKPGSIPVSDGITLQMVSPYAIPIALKTGGYN